MAAPTLVSEASSRDQTENFLTRRRRKRNPEGKKGEREEEIGFHGDKPIIKVDPRYYRPAEVGTLLGDPSKAKKELGWAPQTTFEELVEEMTTSDLEAAKAEMG